MMGALMSNPAFLGTVPALAAALIAGLILMAVSGATARPLTVAAITIGFLVGYGFIEALPPLIAVTAKQKLFYVALVLLIVAGVLDSRGRGGAALQWVVPVVVLGWLTWRLWIGGPDLRLIVEFVVLLAASVFVHWRLRRGAARGALGPGVQLLLAAAGFAIVSVIGASASLAMLGSSLAAATGAVLLLAYIASLAVAKDTGFGALGWLAGGGVLMTTVAATVLFTEDVNRWALAVLVLVFVADLVPVPLPDGERARRALGPVVLGVVSAVPVVAAAVVAWLLSDGGSPY